MNGLDKINIESLLNDPNECQYRTFLREFFEYQIPLACPYKTMLKAFYENLKEKELDKESGLI